MAHEIDKFVGSKVKELRKQKKKSQSVLAEALGISFQQIQKYESGSNRISASMLARIAATLGQPIAAFFPEDFQREGLTSDERDLLSSYRRISVVSRSSINQMAQALANGREA
tara:strand:+ start:1481 stop:1819 length:339 start_codon:yes stop_codon:yes gene_type:complete